MKKILIMTAAMFVTANIFAQGTVNFSNIGGPAVFDATTRTNAPAGAAFTFQLYYLPNPGGTNEPIPTTDLQMMALPRTANLVASGIFNAGNRTAPVTPPGATAFFQVRAWETAFGTSYEDALAKVLAGDARIRLGKSNIVRVDTGDPTTIPPGTAGSLVANGLSRIELTVVPEPSMIGLGLLGVGALLVLRRRK